jgi:hypothetical protein
MDAPDVELSGGAFFDELGVGRIADALYDVSRSLADIIVRCDR